jgi:biopolymer transport protein ExbD
MRKDIYEQKGVEDINVAPLLDLAWTILVVFIIAVTAAIQGIKVNLPKASATPTDLKPTTKAITIQNSGQIYLDTYPVTIEELEMRLRQFKAADPNFPVVVKGDEMIYYKRIIEVLDVLQRVEVTQLGLVTQKLVK